MREYFKEQLEKTKPIPEEKLAELEGKTDYGPYQAGDHLLMFLVYEEIEVEDDPSEILSFPIEEVHSGPSINLTLKTITERYFDKLERDYEFVEMSGLFPMFKKK